MCDYSLHAVASRPAKVGETLVTTTFRGTACNGAPESERGPKCAITRQSSSVRSLGTTAP